MCRLQGSRTRLKSSWGLAEYKGVEKLWFIYANQVVIGPLKTDEVKARIAKGEWLPDACIWWKGQREWLAIGKWESELLRVDNAQKKATLPVWYIDDGEASLGPMTIDELVASLRGVSSLNKVQVWAAGMANWAPIFAVADVMDLLGISRRANERAPLMGSVVLSRPLDGLPPQTCRAASISVGGIGVLGSVDIRKGDRVQVLMKCQDLAPHLHIQAEAIYVMPNGYAGLKFMTLHPEAQSLIHDYIRRFTASDETTRATAA